MSFWELSKKDLLTRETFMSMKQCCRFGKKNGARGRTNLFGEVSRLPRSSPERLSDIYQLREERCSLRMTSLQRCIYPNCDCREKTPDARLTKNFDNIPAGILDILAFSPSSSKNRLVPDLQNFSTEKNSRGSRTTSSEATG